MGDSMEVGKQMIHCCFPTSPSKARANSRFETLPGGSFAIELPGDSDVTALNSAVWKAWALLLKAYTRSESVCFADLSTSQIGDHREGSVGVTGFPMCIAQYDFHSFPVETFGGPDPRRCWGEDLVRRRINTGIRCDDLLCLRNGFRQEAAEIFAPYDESIKNVGWFSAFASY